MYKFLSFGVLLFYFKKQYSKFKTQPKYSPVPNCIGGEVGDCNNRSRLIKVFLIYKELGLFMSYFSEISPKMALNPPPYNQEWESK